MTTPAPEPAADGRGSRRTASSRRTGSSGWSSQPDPAIRVSDSERSDVADRLSKHFQDGRLDQAEFSERLDRAMNAKTHGDLQGLFDDLPGDDPAGGTGGRTREPLAGTSGPVPQSAPRKGRRTRLGFLVLVAIATVFVAQALAHSFIPWLLIGVVAFLWLRDKH